MSIDINNLSQEEFKTYLIKFNKLYYNSETSDEKLTEIIDDDLYDMYMDIYEKKYGKFTEIGAEVNNNDKIKLPIFMPSLNKIKTEEELEKWKKKFNERVYIITYKIDGDGLLLDYNKNDIKLFTRGNGEEGRNVSYLLPYINGIPKKLNTENRALIRGELAMSKEKFKQEKYASKKNSRNTVSGLVNSKTMDIKDLIDITFVAHSIYIPQLSVKKQFKFLKKNGFETPNPVKVDEIDMKMLCEMLKNARESYHYDIDGLVIAHNQKEEKQTELKNPKHIIAFKQNTSTVATVSNVEWRPSRNGLYKPLVHITPIFFDGVEISKFTGHNAKFIVDNGITEGCQIQITRSGNVIPQILSCLNPQSVILPTNAKWNENKVELIIDKGSEDDEINKLQILHYFEALKIKNVGEQTISKLYDSGFDTLLKVLTITKEDILTLDGFKEKSAIRLLNGIAESKENVNLAKLLHASNIFVGLGEKKMNAIIKEYPNLLELIMNKTYNKEEWEEKVSKIKGFKKMAAVFAKGVKKFRKFMKKHPITVEVIEEEKKEIKSDSPLYNKKIVFTGVRDKTLEEKIKSVGGIVNTAVSGKTNILICKDKHENSSKLKKAKDNGIEIYELDEFKEKYDMKNEILE